MTDVRPEQDARIRFDLLLADYQAAREDERSLVAAQGTSISVAVALLALLAAALTQTCNLGSGSNCVRVPDLFLAAAPLGPVAVVAYLAMFGAVSTIRSYYLRALERELRAYAPQAFDGYGEIGPATYAGLTIEVTSLRRGRMGYRLLTNTIFAAVLLVFGGLTAYIGTHVAWPVRIAMLVVYVPIILLILWEVLAATIGGRTLFLHTADRYARRPDLPHVDRDRPEGRNLFSYLLLPRPEDWIKWTIAPGVYAVTAWTVGGWHDWRTFLVLWFVLEFLVYEARYQWNDIRGFAEDLEHPERHARARLPIGLDTASNRWIVMASGLTAVLRLVLALLVGWVYHVFAPTVVLMLVVLGVAVLYEWLRSRPNTWGVGPPSRVSVALWLVVGVGYAVRAALGFQWAGLALTSVGALAGIVCFAAFGVMFVLLTWTLEATSLCRRDARQVWHGTDQLNAKAHVAALLRYVGQQPEPVDATLTDDQNCGDARALEHSSQRLTPWNLALLVATAFGSLLGLTLSGTPPTLVRAGVAVVVGAGSAVAIGWVRDTQNRLIVLGVAALASLLFAVSVGAVRPLAMPVPWLVIAGTYIGFRSASYRDLKRAARRFLDALRLAGLVLTRVVIGSKAADRLDLEPHPTQPARHLRPQAPACGGGGLDGGGAGEPGYPDAAR